MKPLSMFSLYCVLLLAPAMAATAATLDEAMPGALTSPHRSDEEKARDAERKPLETLRFFGLQPNMTVIELLPGGGWYTKVLGEVLKPQGKHYIAVGSSRVADRLQEWGLANSEVISEKAELVTTDIQYVFDLAGLNLDVNNVDMVLTFRNAHNLTPGARAQLNKQVYAALKPGGIYGIVDHTRRHMQPYSRPVWRRLDPVIVIKEALDAGFEFVGYSDLHYHPEDPLSFDTRDERMQGPSDRFTLKFRKPL